MGLTYKVNTPGSKKKKHVNNKGTLVFTVPNPQAPKRKKGPIRSNRDYQRNSESMNDPIQCDEDSKTFQNKSTKHNIFVIHPYNSSIKIALTQSNTPILWIIYNLYKGLLSCSWRKEYPIPCDEDGNSLQKDSKNPRKTHPNETIIKADLTQSNKRVLITFKDLLKDFVALSRYFDYPIPCDENGNTLQSQNGYECSNDLTKPSQENNLIPIDNFSFIAWPSNTESSEQFETQGNIWEGGDEFWEHLF